jgi:HSP20 family protein
MKSLVKKDSFIPSWASSLFDSERFFSPSFWGFDSDWVSFTKRVPSVNVSENEKEFLIEMAAPGLQKSDFKVEIDNGVLTISSEKEEEKNEEQKNYKRREYSYSSFSRSFVLPENTNPEQISAKYENGVLNVTVPKKEATLTKAAKEIKVS